MNSTQSIIIILVVCAALALRIYRQTREQRWPIAQMWIIPALFLVVAALIVWSDTLVSPFAPLTAAVGLAAGVWVGLYQGNHTTLRMDKPGKSVYIRVSPLGSLIFVGIVALRFAVRFAAVAGTSPEALQSGAAPVASPPEALVGSALIGLAVGAVIGLRLFVYRKFADAAP